MSVASGNTNTDILIAGAFAALSIDLLVYPLDTIKTRIQAPSYKSLYIKSNGAVDRALFRGLYQGVFSVILATVPSSGAFFTTYEATKSLFHNLNKQLPSAYTLPTPLLHSAASAVAESVSCLILTPAEVLKQNAQVIKKSTSASSSTQAFDAAATRTALNKFSHPSQLWRGYTALVARNLPFTAMQFPLFEGLKVRLLEWRKDARRKAGFDHESGTLLERGLITGVAAGVSGSFSAVVTTPVDVVKTRIMLAAASSSGSDSPDPTAKGKLKQSLSSTGKDAEHEAKRTSRAVNEGRKGGFAIGRDIWQQKGIKGLFRGGLLRGVWTALGSGLYLSVYESGRQYLEDRRKNKDDD